MLVTASSSSESMSLLAAAAHKLATIQTNKDREKSIRAEAKHLIETYVQTGEALHNFDLLSRTARHTLIGMHTLIVVLSDNNERATEQLRTMWRWNNAKTAEEKREAALYLQREEERARERQMQELYEDAGDTSSSEESDHDNATEAGSDEVWDNDNASETGDNEVWDNDDASETGDNEVSDNDDASETDGSGESDYEHDQPFYTNDMLDELSDDNREPDVPDF